MVERFFVGWLFPWIFKHWTRFARYFYYPTSFWGIILWKGQRRRSFHNCCLWIEQINEINWVFEIQFFTPRVPSLSNSISLRLGFSSHVLFLFWNILVAFYEHKIHNKNCYIYKEWIQSDVESSKLGCYLIVVVFTSSLDKEWQGSLYVVLVVGMERLLVVPNVYYWFFSFFSSHSLFLEVLLHKIREQVRHLRQSTLN